MSQGFLNGWVFGELRGQLMTLGDPPASPDGHTGRTQRRPRELWQALGQGVTHRVAHREQADH
jgi:hypothetical protein